MGYEVVIKKPENLDQKYSPLYKDMCELNDHIRMAEMDLVTYCMTPHDNADYRKISMQCRFYVKLLEDRWKLGLKHNFDTNGETLMCGWEYSRECDFEIETVLNNMIEQLCLLAYVVKTPDYFDDCDKFYDKVNAVKETLDVDELIYSIWNHMLKDDYYIEDDLENDDCENDDCGNG